MTKYYSKSKQKFIEIANMPDQYVRNAFVKMCKHEPTEDAIYAEQQRERADRSMKLRNDLFEENVELEVQVKHYKKLANENSLHEINQDRFELQKQVKHYKKLAEDNFASSVADLDSIEKLTKQNNELQGMYDKLKDTTYQPYDNQGRVRDYQVEYSKVAKERDSYKKKANDMEMAKMNINRELLDAKDKLKDTVTREVYNVMWDNCQKLEEEVRLLRGSREMAYDRIKSFMPKGDVKMFSEIPNTDDGWEFVDKLKRYLNKESYKIRVRGQYLDDETKKTEGWKRYSFGQPIEKSKCLRVYVDINNG